MPLTAAHAAAAWPINRLLPRLPLEPLLLGTLTPDFQYFLYLAPYGRFGHTLPGLFLFCLPVGLLAWIAYLKFGRPALLSLLPGGLRQLLNPPRHGVLLVSAALLVGATTHIVWDSFTHQHGWVVRQLPALSLPVQVTPQLKLPGFKLLQHASTLMGLAVVFLWARQWLQGLPAEARKYSRVDRSRRIRTAALLLLVGPTAAVANGLRGLSRGRVPALGYAAVAGMAAVMATLIVAGGLSQLRTGVNREE
jgi:hypothetical protein